LVSRCNDSLQFRRVRRAPCIGMRRTYSRALPSDVIGKRWESAGRALTNRRLRNRESERSLSEVADEATRRRPNGAPHDDDIAFRQGFDIVRWFILRVRPRPRFVKALAPMRRGDDRFARRPR
jgi:hypothetical protein